MGRSFFIKRLSILAVLGVLPFLALLVYLQVGESSGAEKPYVNVYNWYGMIPADLIKQFEQETGITIRYDLYDNNEIVEAKLFASNSGYDVIFPSAAPYVHRQIEAGAYQPLQKEFLPNMVHLDPVLNEKMESVDPGLNYSLPYYWGTFGFAYIAEIIEERLPNAPVDSYALLFDPEVVSKFADCGVTLLEESVDIYPAVLAYMGLDPQSSSPEELALAQAELLKIRPYIKRFSSSRFVNELVGGESCLAQAWSGEAHLANDKAQEVGKNITINYTVPKEGGVLWIDAIAIPKGAPHPKNAHLFINFLLRPEVSARIINVTKVAVANKDALPMVDAEIKDNETIYPPAEILEKLKLDRTQNSSYEKMRTRFWSTFKLSSKKEGEQNGQ